MKNTLNVRMLKEIRKRNQEKLDAILDSQYSNAFNHIIIKLYDEICHLDCEIIKLRNERIKSLFRR